MILRVATKLGIALVALATLAWSYAWRSDAPEPVDWRAAFGEAPLRFGWENLFAFAGEPNRVGFRLLHTAALATPGADFHRLALLGWVLAALACVLFVRAFPRSEVLGGGTWRLLGVLVLVGNAFSPRFGASFLLDARFRVFVPALCLAAATHLLLGSVAANARWPRLRVVAAAVLAFGAATVERAGLVVGIALIPLVVHVARRSSRSRTFVAVVLWCLVGNLVVAFCADELAASAAHRAGALSHLRQAPGFALAFVARVLAHGLPDLGFSGSDPTVVVGATLAGLGALAILRVAMLPNDDARKRRALPFVGFVAFGLGVAVLALEHDVPLGVAEPLYRETTWGMLTLPIGVLGLWLAIAPRLTRVLARAAALGLLVGSIADWVRELPRAAREGLVLRQGEALLAFSEIGSGVLPRAPRPPIVDLGELAALRQRNLLRRAPPVRSLVVTDYSRRADAPPGVAGTLVECTRSTARGSVVDRPDLAAPELVLLARSRAGEAELVFAIAAPDLYAPGPDHPFVAEFGDATPLREGERVRAYGFRILTRDLELLTGSRVVRDGAPTTEPGGPR